MSPEKNIFKLLHWIENPSKQIGGDYALIFSDFDILAGTLWHCKHTLLCNATFRAMKFKEILKLLI